MRRFSKSLLLFLLMFVFMLLPSQPSSAAVTRPDKVRKLIAGNVTNSTATLKWTNVKGATGYYLYRVNIQTKRKKLISRQKSREYKLTGLQVGTTYSYQVFAFKKSKGKDMKSKNGSPIITVKPNANSPAKVEKFRLICYGDKSVFLAWDKVSNAQRYALLQYDKKTKKYVRIATTTDTTYQVKNLKAGENYRFIVRSFRIVNGVSAYSVESAVVKATGKNINVSDVHGRYWSATLKADVVTKDVTTGKTLTLKKGTKVATTSAHASVYKAILSDGRKVSINKNYLSVGNLQLASSYDYYSVEQLEAFINGQGYTSNTDWLIWINQYSASVNIFKGAKGMWKLMRRMPCIIGQYGKTPFGDHYRLIRRTTAAGRPQIYFTWNNEKQWGNSFHCRIDSNTRGAYSSGCVRLGDSDLYYLANNCPLGTAVISH